MTNSKTTRKALLSSVLALTLCVAMLIATTFAWFTDTASTSVNKIQAGTLDVALEMATAWDTEGNPTTWASAEGKTLSWKQANTSGSTYVNGSALLWEPGCTYELQPVKIINEGNLALKYKVLFSATDTDAENLELAKVLDVTMNNQPAGTLYDVLTSTDADGYAHGNLEGNTETEPIILSVEMRETAGNEYQGLSIGGIAITVVATQDTAEFDSASNTYDGNAKYPVVAVTQVAVNGSTKATTAEATIKSVETISQENTTSLATATMPAGVKTAAAERDTSTQLELTINEAAVPANFTAGVTVNESDVVKTLEVKMNGLATNNEIPIKIEMYVGSGMDGFKLYHNNSPMTSVDSEGAVDEDQEYYYNSKTGMVTMNTATFSPFTYVYDASIKVASLTDLAEDKKNAEPGYYKLTPTVTVDKSLYLKDGVDIDLNNFTLTVEKNWWKAGQEVVNVGFHNGKIKTTSVNELWISADGTANLTFNNVKVDADNGNVFRMIPDKKECTLNITGNEFTINNGKFLYAKPNWKGNVNVAASGVSVKQINYSALAAVQLEVQYNNNEIAVELTDCTFDNTIRAQEPIVISKPATNANSSVSLTMTNCSLLRTGTPESLDRYIAGYSAENVTLTLNGCTGNDGAALTVSE